MRFIVGVINGDGQAVRVKPPFLGDECPRVVDRLLLEIVAEREIAEHFEERVVPSGIADIVEIIMLAARAHAFLARRGSLVRPRLEAGEDILEWHHPRIDEHQRRIIMRHQRRGRHTGMAAGFEIVEETAADVVCRGHRLRLGERGGMLKLEHP